MCVSQSRAELAQIKQEEVEGIEREDNTDEVDQCLQCLQNTIEKIEALHGRTDTSQIAQGEISRSVAFPTHVWKMPNICTDIIVWLFSHMCAFSHTYVSKSKHVWKIAPRCKYTNVFVFSKHVG